mgnify:CR=1 FL=1|tara:strand:- start:3720 stop:4502 length:783 start_codon:yes stop_codon:yes gene_type:complete
MNYLTYTFNKIIKPFRAYDGWNEVPFHKFVKYKQMIEDGTADDVTKVYEMFLPGTTSNDWKKAHNPKLYESINGQLAFLSLEPTGEVATDINRGFGKKNYKVHTKIEDCTAGEYWDMQEVAKKILQNKSTEAEIVEIMPKLIAVLCCKERTEESINKVAKELEQLPTNRIYPLGCFFLQKLTDLKSGTGIIHRFKKLIQLIAKQVMARLVIILVIISRCITFQKGSLASLKLSLIRLWLKCTRQYKLTLILTTQEKNIEK